MTTAAIAPAIAPDDDDKRLHAALLASLPACGPARLTALLANGRTPTQAWGDVLAGRAPCDSRTVKAAWRRAAADADPRDLAARLDELAIVVLVRGHPGYPTALDDDPEPPPVLFTTGVVPQTLAGTDAPHTGVSAGRRVAIVGTRRCTGYGSDVARTLGRDLAQAGVTIVSGLAAGIDGAAHEGVLAANAAPPLAIVGSGLDVVYPRKHRRLWRDVAAKGLVVSEAPLGAAPEPWRFPLRNRIIAGLAEVVVVVESHAGGGSMHTVQAAIDRGVPVMAVPGSVRSPSSIGTNRLLADGVPPVLDATDVLVALSITSPPLTTPPSPPPPPRTTTLTEPERRTLAALDWSPTATEDVLRRTRLPLGQAAAALTRLEIEGLARNVAGSWERR